MFTALNKSPYFNPEDKSKVRPAMTKFFPAKLREG